MNENVLDILLFLKEIEYSVNMNNETGKEKEVEEIIIWIPFYKIDEFMELVPEGLFDDGGMDVSLLKEYIALDFKDAMEYFLEDEEIKYIIKKLKEWE